METRCLIPKVYRYLEISLHDLVNQKGDSVMKESLV